MATKTVPLNIDGVARLPNDKPVVYWIKTEHGTTNYVGIAHRGRAEGAKVQVGQKPSIRKVRATERRIVARLKPLMNRQG